MAIAAIAGAVGVSLAATPVVHLVGDPVADCTIESTLGHDALTCEPDPDALAPEPPTQMEITEEN
jgi:hypothetical protein